MNDDTTAIMKLRGFLERDRDAWRDQLAKLARESSDPAVRGCIARYDATCGALKELLKGSED